MHTLIHQNASVNNWWTNHIHGANKRFFGEQTRRCFPQKAAEELNCGQVLKSFFRNPRRSGEKKAILSGWRDQSNMAGEAVVGSLEGRLVLAMAAGVNRTAREQNRGEKTGDGA